MATPAPEFGRKPKAGLERPVRPATGPGSGTPAPGGGFAFTIAQREIAKLVFAHEHDRPDVETGVALVAAKRASLAGRGPILEDVRVAMDLFHLRDAAVVGGDVARPFSGLAHSYSAQRNLVDAVDTTRLFGESAGDDSGTAL